MDEDAPNSFTRNKIKHGGGSACTGGSAETPAEIEEVTRVQAAV
jgi:hypothetical protein